MASTSNLRLAKNLAALVLGMLMLSYASVPLYRLFCEATGMGGTTQKSSVIPETIADRKVNVRFNADISPDLPWKFSPGEPSLTLNIGENRLTYYTAQNLSDTPITGHATYNVTPFKAGKYFTKIECFCFKEQTLQPHQKVTMPVSFYIDPAMLADRNVNDITTITLSYTFFPLKK